MDPLAESKTAEAAHAAAFAKQADIEALHSGLVQAIKEAFTDDDPINRPLLIRRIPAICNDIRDIKADMKWIKWLVVGMTTGIGSIVVAVIIAAATTRV